MNLPLKPVEWIGTSLDDLKKFPSEVQQVMGYAVYLAQCGEKHPDTKPLKGFRESAVLEVVEDFDGNTYRGVYTIKFEGIVYVLHTFQKKSKRGIATPKQDIKLIEARWKRAQEHYEQHYRQIIEENKDESGK